LDTPRSGFWKRYSLRALFVVMTLSCVLLGLWAAVVDPYRLKAECVAALRRLPSEVTTRSANGAAWKRWLVTMVLGDEAFVDVDVVELRGPKVDDEMVAKLGAFPRLRSLTLDQTQTTDQGLAVLGSLDELEELTLTYSQATDLGVESLKGLPRLKVLRLTGTQITDASVPELAELPALETVFLRWTGVTDEGAAKLRELAPDCTVYHHALANAKAP
jgi:hypothetical protein